MPMDPRDKWRLRSNRIALLDIDTEQMCPHLIAKGIITPDDSERIGHEATHKDKAESLLNLLEGKGEQAYRVFRDTLGKLEPKRGDLVQKLDNTDMSKMPAKLQRECNASASPGGDTPDRGNIIITDTNTPRKRQVRIEDEGSAEAKGPQKQSRRSRGAVISVRGSNNVVMNNSRVTYNIHHK